MSDDSKTTFRRRFAWRLSVIAAAMAIGAGAVAIGAPPVSAAPPDAPKVTLIGDSTMAAMGWYTYDNDDADTANNNDIREIIGNTYELSYHAESCRRLVMPSCRGRFGYTPRSTLPLMRTTLNGQLGEVLVLMAGYDDPSISSAADAIMAEAEAQGVEKVLWLTFRTTTRYVLPGGLSARNLYERHNAELWAASQRHPAMQILDWDADTRNLTSWFATDGIHLTRDGAVGLANYIKTALDAAPIGRCRATKALTGVADPTVGDPAAPDDDHVGFVARTPERVLDTRDPNLGGANGKLGAGRSVAIDVSDVVADDATAAALNVVATDTCGPGFVTVFACGERPWTSNLNLEPRRDTAAMAITAMTDGEVCVYASAATDIVVDVIGSFAPGGELFHPITPQRWVDTRGEPSLLTSLTGERVGVTETEIPIAGRGDVPDDASAVWLNATIADPTAPTVIAVYPGPCGDAPLSSNVNARTGRSAAAGVLVGLGDNGSICVRTVAGASHLVIDVAGWFGGESGLLFHATSPTRLLDSREGTEPDAGPTEHRIELDATTVLNVTAVDASTEGFVTARPCGAEALSSVINTVTGEDMANVIAVRPNDGGVCITPSVAAHIVVDQVGEFVTQQDSNNDAG